MLWQAAEKKGAHQGIAVMSCHVVIDDIMEWFNSCIMEASWWITVKTHAWLPVISIGEQLLPVYTYGDLFYSNRWQPLIFITGNLHPSLFEYPLRQRRDSTL